MSDKQIDEYIKKIEKKIIDSQEYLLKIDGMSTKYFKWMASRDSYRGGKISPDDYVNELTKLNQTITNLYREILRYMEYGDGDESSDSDNNSDESSNSSFSS